LIGIGIGMIMTSILLSGVKINYEMSKGKVEIKARGYGMRYPDEMTIITKEGAK
jgi:hypothetical protein